MSRRSLLARGAALAALPVWAGKAAAEPACHDPNVQTDAFVAVSYTEESDNPREVCRLCMYFEPGSGGCGTCKRLHAPVNPKGYCECWTSK